MLHRVHLFATFLLGAFAPCSADSLHDGTNFLRSCDESFPLAPPAPPHSDSQNSRRHHLFPWRREPRLVAIQPGENSHEFYETGEYYAPICPGGERVDIRKLFRCNSGACWNEFISQCTFECTWNAPTPRPTSVPTQVPTIPRVATVIVEEALLIDLKNLAEMYRINAKFRSDMIRYLYNKLKNEVEDLPFGMQLLELNYMGRLSGRPHSLPLNAKLKGPKDVVDNALSYLQQLVRDWEQDIVQNFKMLDESGGKALKDIRVVAGTYDFRDIIQGEWATNAPTISPATVPDAVIMASGIREQATPWWVWLIVALVVLLCVFCCACACIRHNKKRKEENKKKVVRTRQQFNVTVKNQSQRLRRDPSFHENKGRKRTPQRTRHTEAKRMEPTKKSRVRETRAMASASAPFASTKRDADLELETSVVVEPWPVDEVNAFDGATAVSAFPDGDGFDPPEEQHAIVLYNPNPNARDPTYYTDRMIVPRGVEPEGSVADASLMSEVRSKRAEVPRERKCKNTEIVVRENAPDPQEEQQEEEMYKEYHERYQSNRIHDDDDDVGSYSSGILTNPPEMERQQPKNKGAFSSMVDQSSTFEGDGVSSSDESRRAWYERVDDR